MTTRNGQPDPEDLFADTRMSFGDHLEELRLCLWRALIGFFIAMLGSFFIGKPVLENLIINPVEEQLRTFYQNRLQRIKERELHREVPNANGRRFVQVGILRQDLIALLKGEPVVRREAPPEEVAPSEVAVLWLRFEDPRTFYGEVLADPALDFNAQFSMKTMNVTEAFMVYFKVSIYCGLVIASPWIFWQIWTFVAAGLYPHEKRLVHFYLPVSLSLFLAGVLVCQFLVLPKAIGALLMFNEWLNIDPDLRLNEWLSFAIMFPLLFGISFQTPLVMLFLERIGICTVETYRSKRKYAIFILFVISAVGPSIDVFSLIFQGLALSLLYELGIWLCLWLPRPKDPFDLDVPESDELVEV
ncbi:MAG: twin-arginine translocase subunit TatC [Gemmataceae bacterium]|nr:twin-arginine translocase subunit TatC [Gemmataceae bacterium]MDW8264613.1 twin-arginine translocase subunit TatC [Gemmataceae bacterium]